MDKKAKELYDQGNDYDAGAMIVAGMRTSDLPRWAGKILELLASQGDVSEPIRRLIDITKNEDSWLKGSDLFHEIREQTLVAEDSSVSSPYHIGILYLAENVAKVVANASGNAKFDSDCAHWIPQNVRYLIENGGLQLDPGDLLKLVFSNQKHKPTK